MSWNERPEPNTETAELAAFSNYLDEFFHKEPNGIPLSFVEWCHATGTPGRNVRAVEMDVIFGSDDIPY